jgi:chaperonin cofactor prefoldin
LKDKIESYKNFVKRIKRQKYKIKSKRTDLKIIIYTN